MTTPFNSSRRNDCTQRRYSIAFICLALATIGCAERPVEPPVTFDSLAIAPRYVTMFAGDTLRFAITGTSSPRVTWRIESGPGSIDPIGLYTAPSLIARDSITVVVGATTDLQGANAKTSVVTLVADTSTRACFERDVRPIFRSSCALAGCHDPGARQKGYDFTSDVAIQQGVKGGEPDQSLIHVMITDTDESKRMPPTPRPRLTSQQVLAIRRWIEQGARLTGCPSPGDVPCDTSSSTYSRVIRPILLTFCTACHEQPTPDNLVVDLSLYSGVKVVAESGQLLGAINHSPGYAPMPTASSKLDECDIMKIQTWIDTGAPDN